MEPSPVVQLHFEAGASAARRDALRDQSFGIGDGGVLATRHARADKVLVADPRDKGIGELGQQLPAAGIAEDQPIVGIEQSEAVRHACQALIEELPCLGDGARQPLAIRECHGHEERHQRCGQQETLEEKELLGLDGCGCGGDRS